MNSSSVPVTKIILRVTYYRFHIHGNWDNRMGDEGGTLIAPDKRLKIIAVHDLESITEISAGTGATIKFKDTIPAPSDDFSIKIVEAVVRTKQGTVIISNK